MYEAAGEGTRKERLQAVDDSTRPGVIFDWRGRSRTMEAAVPETVAYTKSQQAFGRTRLDFQNTNSSSRNARRPPMHRECSGDARAQVLQNAFPGSGSTSVGWSESRRGGASLGVTRAVDFEVSPELLPRPDVGYFAQLSTNMAIAVRFVLIEVSSDTSIVREAS